MVSTLGEAHDLGWRIHVRCAAGRHEGLKRRRECLARTDLDMATLLWTRGRDFPLDLLASRLRCPRCGSRIVRVAFQPPAVGGRMRA